MAMDIKPVVGKGQPEVVISVTDFKAGYVSLVDEARLPPNAAHRASNLMQTQDGLWSMRWGSRPYGAVYDAQIDGAWQHVKADGTTQLLVVSDGKLWRSVDGGSATQVTGVSFTAGTSCYFLQIAQYTYIANGVDDLVRYESETPAASTFSGLSTPGSISFVRTGLTAGSINVFYQVSAVNEVGETPAGTESTTTVNKPRDSWIYGTDSLALTWNRITGAARYNIYYSDAAGQEVFLDSIADPGTGTTVTYSDVGGSSDGRATNSFIAAPVGDTTTGPHFAQMELSGNRIWATGDPDNPWRVYWGGTGQFQGAFSPFYGGGYIDLEKGGRERPKAVVHYRNGTGASMITVLTSDPSGNGSIWQIDLQDVTVGSTAVTIPVANKLVGSVGTTSAKSVVKVRNSVYFFNSKGEFSIGPKPSLLNVLSTDELSVNIRPDIKSVTGPGVSNVAGYYFDGKLFVSMPVGSDVNNKIAILDVERRNWSAFWDVGVERFIEYTDTVSNTHFLAVTPGGNQLIEFSEDYSGDSGVMWASSYVSPLIPINKDRTRFAKMQKTFIELTGVVGTLTFEIIGYEKKSGISTLATLTFNSTASAESAGFSSDEFSAAKFSQENQVTVITLASVKKLIRLNKLINAIQWRLTTNTLGTKFSLTTLQSKGFLVKTKEPSSWRQSRQQESASGSLLVTEDGIFLTTEDDKEIDVG